jgi:cytoskeletal protein CcmA (bactofilin family)
MWRKSNDAKPSSQPSAKVPAQQPVIPEPVKSPAAAVAVSPAATSVPAPTMPPVAPPAAPVYSAPEPRNIVAHDTSAPSSLGSGIKIRGELSGSSDLHIDGEAQGKITLAESRVTIGPNGRVQVDIDAREIIVEGTVQGNLKARESIRLAASSQFQGSILTPRIRVDEGAKLRGKVEMTKTGDSRGSAIPEKAAEKAAYPAAYKAAVASTESEPSKR